MKLSIVLVAALVLCRPAPCGERADLVHELVASQQIARGDVDAWFGRVVDLQLKGWAYIHA